MDHRAALKGDEINCFTKSCAIFVFSESLNCIKALDTGRPLHAIVDIDYSDFFFSFSYGIYCRFKGEKANRSIV